MQKQQLEDWLETEYEAGYTARMSSHSRFAYNSEPWIIGWDDADRTLRSPRSSVATHGTVFQGCLHSGPATVRAITIKRRAARFIPPGRQTFDDYFAKSVGLDLSQ
jgi:hypothetical protein